MVAATLLLGLAACGSGEPAEHVAKQPTDAAPPTDAKSSPGDATPAAEAGGVALVPLDLEALRANALAKTAAAPAKRPLQLVEVRDANGQVCSRLPLPDDWRLRDLGAGRYELNAPGDVKVNATESVSYAWSDDPFMRETIARTGSQLAPVLSIERIVREGIEPEAERQGYRLTGTRELPELQALWQAILAAMPATGSRRTARVAGTEWQGPGDARSFIVVLQTVTASAQSVNWTVQTTELEAPAARFDDARDTWLDALAHTQIDERWQQAKGMQLTESLRRIAADGRRWLEISAAQHRQRMADIAALGEASRQAGRTSSEILDRGHESFRRRSAANDVGQARTVDGIHERTVVVHPETGQRYEVQAGYRFYWSDGDRGYFGTDDPNFDPRLDPALRHLPWVRMGETGR